MTVGQLDAQRLVARERPVLAAVSRRAEAHLVVGVYERRAVLVADLVLEPALDVIADRGAVALAWPLARALCPFPFRDPETSRRTRPVKWLGWKGLTR